MQRVLRAGLSLLAPLPDSAVGSVLSIFFARAFKRFEAATSDPRAAQRDRLHDILTRLANTEIGKKYDFSNIADPETFQNAIPIMSWDDVEPYVRRMIAGERNILVPDDVFFYATSSGTTGAQKLIPVTSAFVREFRIASTVWARALLTSVPSVIRGKMLTMHSPEKETLERGIKTGSITSVFSGGLADADSPFDAVPAAVFRVEDFRTRYFLCLRFALTEPVTVVAAINPSTVLLFARTFVDRAEELASALETGTLGPNLELEDSIRAELQSKVTKDAPTARKIRESAARHGAPRLADLWPGLQLICTWKGGTAPWYLAQLPEHYGELPILDYGYAATEGNFAVPTSVRDEGLVLVPNGHFLEFMPEDEVDAVRSGNARALLMHELEEGRRYYVLVTTSAGLIRYDMNDVVEVTGKFGATPRIVFVHKGGTMSSITGEKLSETQVIHAVQTALGSEMVGFTLAPVLPEPSSQKPPHYVLAYEGSLALSREQLGEALDRALGEQNSEYSRKRESMRLSAIEVRALSPGTFDAYRARRVRQGAPDAHVKIPHLSPDRRILDALLEESEP